MSKTGKLDNLFMRLVVLAAVLIGVVYFMLDKKFGTMEKLTPSPVMQQLMVVLATAGLNCGY